MPIERKARKSDVLSIIAAGRGRLKRNTSTSAVVSETPAKDLRKNLKKDCPPGL
jgi:hypothetical protein